MEVLIDQLVQQGVVDFFIGSGSRSTPLVMAAARHPKAKIHTHLDERALAFFALGCALAKEAPVAIIVTSGTAVGNLLPAVMEAHHASVPLILLTADRPAELRESGANQTTDQLKIFANFTRWQFDLDPTMSEKAIRSKAVQAVFKALSPPGPVQINCPLREPLYRPAEPHSEGRRVPLEIGRMSPTTTRNLPANGLILIGRLPKRSDLHSILQLAHRLQWPVFADVLSNARLHPTPEQIRRFDWIQDAPKPSCILHFGDRFVSKRILNWSTNYIHISPYTHWFDPNQEMAERIQADPELIQFTADPNPGWLEEWRQLDREAEERLTNAFKEASFNESAAIRSLSQISLDRTALFLGTSMPVREADWFLFPKKAKAFFSNRGLSGIDGNIATAAGLAEGLQTPILTIVGDMTALHDLNALSLVKKSKHPIILLISNNGGGGIFSHLSVANDPRFGELFAFEHNLRFAHAAALYDLPFYSVSDLESLKTAIQTGRSCIIEMINSRAENYTFHQLLKQLCLSSFSTAS
jgi:2-succinyl-5-enolpyruvyl-6-hydroxy-3-cyclohexene-1-carboxylate synthase